MWWLSPAINAVAGIAGQLIQNRSARREARAMREYNTPVNQMARFKEAGLSPYLMYSQGNAGNMSSPIPAQESGVEHIGKGAAEALGNYMNWKNFQNEQRMAALMRANMLRKNSNLDMQNDLQFIKHQRQALELYADFPSLTDTLTHQIKPHMASDSFRRKMNELRQAASEVTIQKVEQTINNLRTHNQLEQYRSMVEGVKAKYATDFGMVGGDWTQGLGLLKSIPSMFKGARKVVPKVPPGSVNQSVRKIPGKLYNSTDFWKNLKKGDYDY